MERWLGRLVCVLGVCMLAACGPESNEADATGGASGAGGSSAGGGSGGSSGGSGGSAATGGTGGDQFTTPSAMGFTLTLGKPDLAKVPNLGSRACHAGTVGGFTYAIGTPKPGGTVEDGTNGVTVSCLVPLEGTFSLQASGNDDNGKKPLSLAFSGTVNDKNDPSKNFGSLSFYSPDTLTLTTLSEFPPCTIGPITTIKRGAVLTDIDCPLIAAADDTTSGCDAHGTLAFEYCKTGEEESP